MNPLGRLLRTIEKPEKRIIGLMSGMSMDGVDLACARIRGSFPALEVVVEGTHFRSYDEATRERLLAGRNASVAEVAQLGRIVAREFASCVNEYLARAHLHADQIDAIGSHGQTLFHSTGEDEPLPA